MSTLTIKERFALEAPPELVWEYLIDPHRTVACLPGAELTGQEDESTYTGTLKVKVGAVTVAYRGQITFEEMDAERRYVRAVGKGREKTGSGSATMTMQSTIVPLDGGGSEVTVESDVRLTGRIVRFGRGMIDTVSAEIFKEFRLRLAALLQAELDARTAWGPEDERVPTLEIPAPLVEGRDNDALPLIPLLFRALRSWLGSLFGKGSRDGAA